MTRAVRAFLEDFRSRLTGADAPRARRASAVGLLALAAFLAVRTEPTAGHTEVLVAAHDLAPGQVLGDGDLRTAPRETATLPAGALRDAGRVRGATLAGGLAAGEIVTEPRVVGSRLAALAAHAPDARIVPIRLADNAVAEILRAGDRVDVVAGADSGGGARAARLLASDAVVVLVSGSDGGRGRADRVVLVALDSRRATTVAAASLRTALTVVFH
ncbi:SAF domain-containing protein [Nocardia sp. NPDC059240]|uniref:SAF domain-containing protein n=1 Tax=Nocardia sp. NPDC059240 TaxID=3346786 RepID=UPI0036890209